MAFDKACCGSARVNFALRAVKMSVDKYWRMLTRVNSIDTVARLARRQLNAQQWRISKAVSKGNEAA